MASLATVSWADIDEVRAELKGLEKAVSLQSAAQSFVASMSTRFEEIVLARLFVVVPFDQLPTRDRHAATSLVSGDPRLQPRTRVLSLLGTSGRQPQWNDRTTSEGHLAIPLLDQQFVQGIPMIASLLGDLEIDLAGLSEGRSIATRRMLGGQNSTFYVADATDSLDTEKRHIIPNRPFVTNNKVKTVFGMGGAWVDGTLAVSIFFTDAKLDRLAVDRFPSLISNFKMATSSLVRDGRLYG